MESRNIDIASPGSVWSRLDWWSIGMYLVLVVVGAISVYAASYNFDHASMFDLSEFSGKQFLWIGLACVIGCCLLLINYKYYEIYAYPLYALILVVLLLTIFIAPPVKGSHSWIVMGPVSLQPAEFGKFITALALARLLSTYGFTLKGNPANYCRALIIMFLPVILILLQRETGSALVYFSLIFVLYREGMPGMILLSVLLSVIYFVVAVKYSMPFVLGITTGEFTVLLLITVIFILMLRIFCREPILARNVTFGALGIAAIIAILGVCGVQVPLTGIWVCALIAGGIYATLWGLRHRLRPIMVSVATVIVSILFLFSVDYVFNNVLEPHQQVRIKVVLGIEDDIRGVGYNVNQAKIAIGSGGLVGKGFLNGTQTKLNYVPEQHTDFIFCTVGEEEGFLGTTALLIVFTAFILRLLYLAERQTYKFSRIYGYCVVSYLIFHLLINVGMVIGLCPVIGIPLPLISYGGSSLWSFTILIFIFLRLDAAR